MNAEREARMALCCVAEPGTLEVAAAVSEYGAVTVWQSLSKRAGPLGRRAGRIQLPQIIEETQRAGARFVIPGDPEWPQQLSDLDQVSNRRQAGERLGGAPLGLWVRGPLQLTEACRSSLAVVGSRASTGYGNDVAADLSSRVAAAGVTVVSGAAYGIDSAAHQGALGGGGASIAVLACGVDEAYPRGSAGLLRRLAMDHLIVSELPPGSHPSRSRFLGRNRLIAALAQAVVVVEAGARSGARNTASWATGLGRVLLAVPGPVTSANSVTPNRLIRDRQAELVADAADILEILAPAGRDLAPEPSLGPAQSLDTLPLNLFTVVEALPGRGAVTSDELALQTGLELPELLTSLAELEHRGLVHQRADGSWSLARLPSGQG